MRAGVVFRFGRGGDFFQVHSTFDFPNDDSQAENSSTRGSLKFRHETLLLRFKLLRAVIRRESK